MGPGIDSLVKEVRSKAPKLGRSMRGGRQTRYRTDKTWFLHFQGRVVRVYYTIKEAGLGLGPLAQTLILANHLLPAKYFCAGLQRTARLTDM